MSTTRRVRAERPTGRRGAAVIPREPVDLSDPVEADNAFRIAMAWRELRRGASMPTLRYEFYGTSDDALEQGQMDTLDLLLIRDGWRMSELAEALRVDPSTATRAVQRLVNAGLAERRHSDDDGRLVLVFPSAEGKRRHADVARRRVDAVCRILSAFSASERAELATLLGRFVDALDELVADIAAEAAAVAEASTVAEAAGTAEEDDVATGGGPGVGEATVAAR
jgi:DNA-binding MarR family transcriptional regulator